MTTPQIDSDPALRATKRPWYRRPLPVACTAAAVVVTGIALVGIPVAAVAASATTSSVVSAPSTSQDDSGSSTTQDDDGSSESFGGTSGSTTTSAVEDATEADSSESTGVVLIDTVIDYGTGAAAGTGMVLTSDGLILTNNHVIEDSTSITVTIASTGETYTATVVGVDVEDDVALLQLEDASGLDTVTIDDDSTSVGDEVTAVGNAEGGGVLMAADGEITALDATVTTSSEGTTIDSETLEGMIEIAADVVSGDSGGALLDDEGEVIGMTTAASSGTVSTTAYAIPIDTALEIVQEILDGDESNGVTLGYPAFLGVGISTSSESSTSSGISGFSGGSSQPGSSSGSSSSGSDTTTSGATISSVYDDTPAAEIGLEAGDVITSLAGQTVTDYEDLSEIISGYDAGDTVSITWTDTDGVSHTATVTLAEGPAA
ncbi:MAG: trypsin-like peptidase domain-containing protein [Microbacterium sp.]